MTNSAPAKRPAKNTVTKSRMVVRFMYFSPNYSGLLQSFFAPCGRGRKRDWGRPNTVQIRRKDKRGRRKTKRQSRWHTEAINDFKNERTCLMIATIPENGLEDKVCQHVSLGLLQDILPVSQIEELLETYQMWEQRERKLNMVAMVYWLLGLHLHPHLSQRAVYAQLVIGLRTIRDDVAEGVPSKSAFSYRRAQLGSEVLEELFAQAAGPQATEQTPGAFYQGMRLLALDGTVESLPDTASNRETFRYSTDDEQSHSPFPQARLVLLVECATHLICDGEISPCRQAEATSMRVLVERWKWENS